MKAKVRIEVCGVNIKKLYKMLKKNNICMQNIETINHKTILFTTFTANYKKLIAITKNSCYNIKVVSHHGIAKLTSFIKNRLGYLIGMILFVLVIAFSSFYVSDIKIYGLVSVSENQIYSLLEQNDIKIGGLISKIETEKVSSIISNEFDKISLISVIKKGTTIIINIKEKQSIDFDISKSNSENIGE